MNPFHASSYLKPFRCYGGDLRLRRSRHGVGTGAAVPRKIIIDDVIQAKRPEMLMS